MRETITLSTKGQLVVPKAVRRRLGWRSGARLVLEEHEDHVVLRGEAEVQPTQLEDLLGCIGYRGRRRTLAEMNRAIAEVEGERARRG